MDMVFRTGLQARLEELIAPLSFYNAGDGAPSVPQVVCTAFAPVEIVAEQKRQIPYLSFSEVDRGTWPQRKEKEVRLLLVIETEPTDALQEQWTRGHDDLEAFVSAIEDGLYAQAIKLGGFKLSRDAGIKTYIGQQDGAYKGMPHFPYFFATMILNFVQG